MVTHEPFFVCITNLVSSWNLDKFWIDTSFHCKLLALRWKILNFCTPIWLKKRENLRGTVLYHFMTSYFRNTTNNSTDHVSIMLNQGIAWEGRIRQSLTPDLSFQVLRGGAGMQLRLVRRAGLPLPDTNVHLMGVLGLLQVRDGAAVGVGHEGPWSWCLHTRLDCCRLIPLQSPHLTLLCYRQRLLWLCFLSLRDHAYSILGVRPVQR